MAPTLQSNSGATATALGNCGRLSLTMISLRDARPLKSSQSSCDLNFTNVACIPLTSINLGNQNFFLKKWLRVKIAHISQLSKQRDELEQRIRERFFLFTYVLIVRFFRQRTDAQAEKTRAVHQKKLTTTGAGNQLLP